MSSTHAFHQVIGDLMNGLSFPECRVLRATECGGEHNLPLFYSAHKSNAAEFCEVDILVLKSERIRVIVEIEEVERSPGKLFGKFAVPAVCWGYIYGPSGEDAPMGDRVVFVQVVNATDIQPNSSKPEQWGLVEKAIRELMPLKGKGARMVEYHLLAGTSSEFRSQAGQDLVALIHSALQG